MEKTGYAYRVVRADGTAVNDRAWTAQRFATLSARRYFGGRVQRGTVVWEADESPATAPDTLPLFKLEGE